MPELGDGPSLELLAGNIDDVGNVDGTGAAARFNSPMGIAADSDGTVYVADSLNSTIRKITPAGVVTTLAGTADLAGGADGTGAAARFTQPAGVATDGAGNIYVADPVSHTIRKIAPAGVVTTLAGTAGMVGSADGTGAAARFAHPIGVAVDRSTGNVYVADQFNEIIRKITAAGIVTTLAGAAGLPGSADGAGSAARFNSPDGMAVDSAGNVYVADNLNSTIRKVTAAGVVSTFAGTAGMYGTEDGMGAVARFSNPAGLAVDSAGNVYVADTIAATIRKITSAGIVTTLAGTAFMRGSVDDTGAAARFSAPIGVAADGAGNVYVADLFNQTIRKITPSRVVTTLAGTVPRRGNTDGIGAAAGFSFPTGVAADGAGNVYVADHDNHTIRKITPARGVSTLAGTAGMLGSADGTRADARFSSPTGVAVDDAGNVYVADHDNHTLRKITPAGVVTTLAGTAGVPGGADGTGANARFNYPAGVAVDGAGNVYVADGDNHTLRKVSTGGVVTTLAGTAGVPGSADGTGANARFNRPTSVAVDSAGNLYVADENNSILRKITIGGVVTTLAGTAGVSGGANGIGADARFNFPTGVAIDSAGNVYVADTKNSIIRKVTPTGTTTTLAGTVGVAGILIGATARFAFPRGLAIVGDSIVVSDANAVLLLRHGAQEGAL